jgi:AraC-like DNA-binding protein
MGRHEKGVLRGPDVLYARSANAAALAKSGAIEVLGTSDWDGEVILRDGFGAVDFDNGISLHFAREVHLAHLDTAATLRPCVSVKLFLEGDVLAEIDGQPIPMPRGLPGGGWQPSGVIVSNRRPVRFRRHASKGSHLVKLIVDLPHDWLAKRLGHEVSPGLADLLDADLQLCPWHPGAEDLAAAGRLFALVSRNRDALAEVEMEGAALGMIARALSAVEGVAKFPGADTDNLRLVRFEALIHDLPGGPVDVAALAQAMRLSSSTLQRLCHRAHGCSVQAHIRARRLAAAHAALIAGQVNIARIAWRAGYGSAANFATAFGRAFGCRPSELRRKAAGLRDGLPKGE